MITNSASTITSVCKLPSLGKVYKESIDPTVVLRTMTTAEEMQRLAQNSYPYRTMSNIIKACIVEGPNIHPYDMCMADYIYLMHQLRIVTYGASYGISSVCPFCGHENSEEISLNDLIVKEYTPEIDSFFEFTLPVTKSHVKIRYQTPRLLDMVNDKVANYRKKSTNKEIDMQIAYTIGTLVTEIDGEPVNPIEIDEWARNLPMLDTQTILAYGDAINNEMGVDKRLEVICDICKLTYNSTFRTTGEFFRPNLHIGRKELPNREI